MKVVKVMKVILKRGGSEGRTSFQKDPHPPGDTYRKVLVFTGKGFLLSWIYCNSVFSCRGIQAAQWRGWAVEISGKQATRWGSWPGEGGQRADRPGGGFGGDL